MVGCTSYILHQDYDKIHISRFLVFQETIFSLEGQTVSHKSMFWAKNQASLPWRTAP